MATVDHLDPREGVTVSGGPGEELAVGPRDTGRRRPNRPPRTATASPGRPASPPSWRWPPPFPPRRWSGGPGASSTGTAGPPTPPSGHHRRRQATDSAPPAPVGRIDEADLHELATIEFAPPAELTPAQGGIVLKEAVTNDHKVAWLIDQAAQGHHRPRRRGPQGGRAALEGRGGPRRRRHPAQDLQPAAVGQPGLLRQELRLRVERARHHAGRLAGRQRVLGSSCRSPPDAGDRVRYPRRARRASRSPWSAPTSSPVASAAPIWPSALGAVLAGVGMTLAVRSWELRVRTTTGHRPVATGRVVPPLHRRVRGLPRRLGGRARHPAGVHGLGGRRR